MKKYVLPFMGVVSLFFVLFAPAYGGERPPGPLIEVSEPFFDFNEVNEGNTVAHTFTLLNRGDQVLEIREVKTSCRCTVARFDQSIPPGGTGKISLQLNTSARQGSIQETATIFSNDPQQPRVQLTLTARVKVFISVEPRGVVLEGYRNNEITKKVTITAHKNEPLTLLPEKITLGGRVAYELKTVEEGKVYQAIFTNISKQEHRYNGTLTLKTNYPEKPELNIRFVGNITGRVKFKPEALNFGRLNQVVDPERLTISQGRQRSTYRRSLEISMEQGGDLKIEKIEIDRELFSTELKELEAGRRYAIEVGLHPKKFPIGNSSETLKVYTNQKEFAIREIPVRVQMH